MIDAQTVVTQRPTLRTRGVAAGVATAKSTPNHSRVFAHIAFFTCLVLQRFGVPFAGSAIWLSLPVFALLIVWLVASGRARIPVVNALLFMLFAGWTAVSSLVALSIFDPYSGVSVFSLIQLLAIYLLFVFRPAADFDGKEVQKIFLFYARLLAIAGIVQFALQFAGIRLFSFSAMFPPLRPVLLESFFNTDAITSYGSSIRRGNGLFLLEPTVLSQIMAIAVYIDYFIVGRKAYLPLYAVAYMCTFSGGGLLTLGLTLLLIAPLSFRNASRAGLIAVTGAAAALVFALLLPSQFQTFAGRFSEIGYSQTSANARYVAPLAQVKELINSGGRALVGFGPGATQRSVYYKVGSGNTALQLIFDYGFVGLALFAIYISRVLWRRDQPGITFMCLIIYELGGNNLQFGPSLLLLASLTIWSETPRLPRTWSAPALRSRRQNAGVSQYAGKP